MKAMDSILGNAPIKNYFRKSMEHQMISHAYIFEGEKGCGKKLLTRTFAKILQCQSSDEKPCGTCTSCIQIEHGNHPDVIWVQHEKPQVISVAEIREQVVNTVDIRPYKGPYKIYIIDEAEKMNIQAQNAILKTIEEPAEYAILFLLTTNRGVFLPTILSRCITMSVKPVATEQISRYLQEEKQIDPGMADFYAGYSMGNLGKAIAISSSEEFREMREHACGLLGRIHEMTPYELDEKVKECKAYKARIADYFDMIRLWFRDLLILKTTGNTERIVYRDAISYLMQQERKISLEESGKVFERISDCERQIRANVNYEAALDLLFLGIKRSFRTS